MKKKLFTLSVAVTMALALLSTVAFAAVGTTDSLKAIIDDAISAGADSLEITGDEYEISNGETLTVEPGDPGGFDTLNLTDNSTITINAGGTLKIAGGVTLNLDATSKIVVHNGGTLDLDATSKIVVNVGGQIVVNSGGALTLAGANITGHGTVSVADWETLKTVLNGDVPVILLTADVTYDEDINITPSNDPDSFDSAQTLTVDEGVTLSPSGDAKIIVVENAVLTVKGSLGAGTSITIQHKGLVSFLKEDEKMDAEYLQVGGSRYFKLVTNGGAFAANGATIAYVADDEGHIDTAPSSVTKPGYTHAGWTYTNTVGDEVFLSPDELAFHPFSDSPDTLLTAQWVSLAPPKTTVTSDVLTVNAQGEPLEGEIGGTIDPHGIERLRLGSSPTYTFEAEEGYIFSHLLIDDVRTLPTASSEYTFDDLDRRHSIVAVFTKGDAPLPPSADEAHKWITDVLDKLEDTDADDSEAVEEIKKQIEAVIEAVKNMTDEQLEQLKSESPEIIEDLQDAYRDLNYLLNETLEIIDIIVGVSASGTMPLDEDGNPVPVKLVLEEITDSAALTGQAFEGLQGQADFVLGFDILLEADGAKVQPDGSITITFGAPDRTGDTLTIAHKKQDGMWEYYTATVQEGGNFSITITELSPFLVLGNQGLIATSVSFDKTDISLNIGQSEMLIPILFPSTAAGRSAWSTSDASVATVDENGKITAIAVGFAQITYTMGEVSATATVTVTEAPQTPTPNPPALPDVPNTGDNGNAVLWALLALASTIGVVICFRKTFAK